MDNLGGFPIWIRIHDSCLISWDLVPVSSPQTYLHDTQVQQIDIDISRLENGKGWWASQELGTPSNSSWITQCVDRITAPQLPIAVSLDPSSFHSLSPSAETFTESTSRYHGFFLTASSDLWRYRYHESVIGVAPNVTCDMLRSKLWFKVPVGSQHLAGFHPTPDPQYWKNVVKPTINLYPILEQFTSSVSGKIVDGLWLGLPHERKHWP